MSIESIAIETACVVSRWSLFPSIKNGVKTRSGFSISKMLLISKIKSSSSESKFPSSLSRK